jgi:hypothetical protein
LQVLCQKRRKRRISRSLGEATKVMSSSASGPVSQGKDQPRSTLGTPVSIVRWTMSVSAASANATRRTNVLLPQLSTKTNLSLLISFALFFLSFVHLTPRTGHCMCAVSGLCCCCNVDSALDSFEQARVQMQGTVVFFLTFLI